MLSIHWPFHSLIFILPGEEDGCWFFLVELVVFTVSGLLTTAVPSAGLHARVGVAWLGGSLGSKLTLKCGEFTRGPREGQFHMFGAVP
jgi:hypothetical protein